MNTNKIYNFIKIALASLVLIFVLNACEQEIDIKLEEQQEELVIFGMLNNTITPYVTMSRSISIFDYSYQGENNIKPIDSASIKIYNDTDTLIMETPSFNENGIAVFFFPNEFNFAPGEIYNLEAEADGLKITARTTIPEMISVSNPEFKRDTVNDIDGYQYVNSYVEFEVDDLDKIEGGVQVSNDLNYYEYFNNRLFDTITGYPIIDTLTGQQMVALDSFFQERKDFNLLYGNEIVNNLNNKLSSNVQMPYYYMYVNQYQYYTYIATTFNLEMKITHYNEDLVKYFKSVNDQYNTLDNPFAEPAFIKGNIEGGIGVFGASTTILEPIELQFECCE